VRLVLDCAHGAASAIGARAFESFGAAVRTVGDAPDGQNINAGAGVFHVAGLAPLVRDSGAELGLSLDGDADRVLLVDEKGSVRDGDFMLGLLAADLAARDQLPERRLVTTVMANMGLFAWCKERDLVCERVPVGDRFVAERMARTGAVLGGEQSGHVIFRRGEAWHGDGLFTGLAVLDVLRRTERTLSELVAGLEKFPQRLENLRVLEKPPVESVPQLVVALRHAEERLGEDGRVVLRYSGTEPLLRVMVEARTSEMVDREVDELVSVARQVLARG
jgi:phosphoglucosamine mutase